MITAQNIQDAIRKGKYVAFTGHNELAQVTVFKIFKSIITIEAGNVRRFKITALDHFLNNVIICNSSPNF